MKKLLVLLFLSCSLFAEEFTWSTYELLCFENGKEPTYKEYEDLVNNPQCYGEDLNIFEE